MTTVKLSKERIKAEKHDFSSEELFSLSQMVSLKELINLSCT
ncbi:hypothetical protein [Pseudoalteromonas sp. OFAV1]|nr:hypothetical protein [Pseudoalteromonas sp. OFAV1]